MKIQIMRTLWLDPDLWHSVSAKCADEQWLVDSGSVCDSDTENACAAVCVVSVTPQPIWEAFEDYLSSSNYLTLDT